MRTKTGYKRIDPHYLQRGGAAQTGGAPEPQPGEPPPGMPAWTGASPMLQRPFGAYMNFPPMAGGYSNPVNMTSMMRAQGGQLQPKEVLDRDPTGSRAEGELPIGSLTLDLSRMKPTPLGMSPEQPYSPARNTKI